MRERADGAVDVPLCDEAGCGNLSAAEGISPPRCAYHRTFPPRRVRKSGATAGRVIYRRWRLGGFEYRSDLIARDYMRRWMLRTPWGMLRLHHILRGDDRTAHHDHPMDFISLILWGGYIEHTPGNPPRECRPGDVVRRRAEDLHYLVLRGKSAWTFLVTGQFRRDWGFMTPDRGWIPASEYDAWRAKSGGVGQ